MALYAFGVKMLWAINREPLSVTVTIDHDQKNLTKKNFLQVRN
jgi:hypothetical protein